MRGRLAFKRAVQILVLLIIILGGAELVAAYMLFRYGVLKQLRFNPPASPASILSRRRWEFRSSIRSRQSTRRRSMCRTSGSATPPAPAAIAYRTPSAARQ